MAETNPKEIRKQWASRECHMIEDMERFNHKYGFNKVHEQELTREFLQFRMRFITEEVQEMCQAHNQNDADDFVDSIIDMIVVGIGTLQFMDVDVRKAWNEVFMSNMTKQRDVNPKREGSGGIDLIKPDSWIAPNHSDNVGILPRIFEERTSLLGISEVGMDLSSEAQTKFYNVEGTGELEKKLSSIGIQLKGKPLNPSVMILLEAIELQLRKTSDYDAEGSGVIHADYYPFGIDSIFQMLNTKFFRIKSILHKMRTGVSANFESLEDTLLDMINYSAFGIAWLRNTLPGQKSDRDIFGKKISNEVE